MMHLNYSITYLPTIGNEPLFKDKPFLRAWIEADSKESAVDKLKDMFNMLTVDVFCVNGPVEVTDEEYENG